MPTEEFESLCQDMVPRVSRFAETKFGWLRVRNQEGVIVSKRRSADFPGMIFKSEGLVHAPPEQVFKYIETAPNSPRLEWDKRLAGVEFLESINPTISIMRSYTTGELSGIIKARDFVDLITVVRGKDYVANVAVSVTVERYPPEPNFVRGFNYPSGIFCFNVKSEPNQTNVVCVLQPDVRGSVPGELVDAVMPSSCEEFYRCLRRYVEKKNKT